MKKLAIIYFILILVSLLFSNCIGFQKIGENAGKGLSSQTPDMGRNLVAGLRDELTDTVTQIKLAKFIDSLLSSVNNSLNPKVKGLRDSLLNKKTLQWADSLVEALTGRNLKMNISQIQAGLIGKTKLDIFQIKNAFHDLLVEILSNETKGKIGNIRDELLGAKTDSAISKIIDHAMLTLASRYKSDLAPSVKEDLSFISKHASTLLVTIGGIAALIIFYVWWNKRKYLRMVTLLTKNIHDIPDKNIYDAVTSNIKSEAVNAGLEPDLRKILEENNIVGTEAWENDIKKKQAAQSLKP